MPDIPWMILGGLAVFGLAMIYVRYRRRLEAYQHGNLHPPRPKRRTGAEEDPPQG